MADAQTNADMGRKKKGNTSQNTAQTHQTNKRAERKKTYRLLKILSAKLFAARDPDGPKVSDGTKK